MLRIFLSKVTFSLIFHNCILTDAMGSEPSFDLITLASQTLDTFQAVDSSFCSSVKRLFVNYVHLQSDILLCFIWM